MGVWQIPNFEKQIQYDWQLLRSLNLVFRDDIFSKDVISHLIRNYSELTCKTPLFVLTILE